MIFITLILVMLVLAPVLYFIQRRKSKQLPPGIRESPIERGVILLGVLPLVKEPFHVYLQKLGQKHGSIFRIKLGMRSVVILHDYPAIKKALKDDSANFAGRWDTKFLKLIRKGAGVMFNDGEVWSKNRSFILKVLKDFGVGKSRMNEIVENECVSLLEEIRELNGEKTDFHNLVSVYAANTIAKFVMNKRFCRDDAVFHFLDEQLTDLVTKRDYLQLVHIMFPILDSSKIVSTLTLWISKRKDMVDKMHDVFIEEIKEHRTKINYNSDGEDLIDRFLIEQHKLIEKKESQDTFEDFQLVRSLLELFAAGYETTSTTLSWSILFLSKHQDVQERVFGEISAIIGLNRIPTMMDKKNLIYTQAVMDEISRLSAVLPLSILHRCHQDTNINGIFVPKDSLVFPNLYACNHDSNVWQKPYDFYPEHFLLTSENGELKYNPRDELIPFSLGKRQCLGESLARAEYFTFLVGIIQQFRVMFAEEPTDKEYEDGLRGTDGLIRSPLMRYFKFQERHKL